MRSRINLACIILVMYGYSIRQIKLDTKSFEDLSSRRTKKITRKVSRTDRSERHINQDCIVIRKPTKQPNNQPTVVDDANLEDSLNYARERDTSIRSGIDSKAAEVMPYRT